MSRQGTKMVLYWIYIFPFFQGCWTQADLGLRAPRALHCRIASTARALEQEEEQRKEGRLHPAVDAAFFVPVLPKVKAAAGTP